MSISITPKKIVTSYLLISILFYGYNMLQLPKSLYFAVRFLLMLVTAVYVIKIVTRNFTRNQNMRMFLFYFLYLVFTLFFIFLYNYPASLLSEAIMDGLFPMLFFFIAIDEKKKSVYEVEFYKYYFRGAIFLFICSVYLFVTMPSWYLDWKISMLPDEWKNNIQVLGTMSGFSNTGYLVGYSSFFAFCYLLFRMEFRLSKCKDYLFLLLVIFCLFFSQVRVALFSAVVVLVWYIVKSFNSKTIFLLIGIALCVFFIFNYFVNTSDFLSGMFDAFTSKIVYSSEDTRYETGINLLSQQTNYLFGHGYGTGGNAANSLGLPSVTDAEYFKLFYETGIIGFTLFVGVIFLSFLKMKKYNSKYTFEFFIISFYLLAMLVADPLSNSPMLCHIFWYSLGRVLL